MEKLLRTVKAQLESWKEWQDAQTIVLAVSGGVDSMVLLRLMRDLLQLRQYQNRRLVVAHFNHRLRLSSHTDANLVKRIAEEYGLMYFSAEWEEPTEQNIEANAREARYLFFAEIMHAVEGDVLMTAHHLNDAAETFMMRLTRGTSLKGMRGIRGNYTRLFTTKTQHAFVAQMMRPLISVTKKEIRLFAEEFMLEYVEDETNESDQFMRNRFRKYQIPALEAENPQFIHNLLEFQTQLQQSYAVHYAEYLEMEPQLVMYSTKPYWLLYIPAFMALDPNKRQIFLMLFFEERLVEDVPDYHRETIQQLEQLMRNQNEPNRRLQLGNDWIAIKRYDYIQMMPISFEMQNQFANSLSIERENYWYQLDTHTRIGIFSQHQVTPRMKEESQAYLNLNLSTKGFKPLKLRHRRAGDTIELMSATGTIFHKKVSRLMIDQKLSAEEREKAWLLCDEEGHIMWMLPNTVSRLYQTPQTDRITHVVLYQELENKGERPC